MPCVKMKKRQVQGPQSQTDTICNEQDHRENTEAGKVTEG